LKTSGTTRPSLAVISMVMVTVSQTDATSRRSTRRIRQLPPSHSLEDPLSACRFDPP
jgi:hypothetical protein